MMAEPNDSRSGGWLYGLKVIGALIIGALIGQFLLGQIAIFLVSH